MLDRLVAQHADALLLAGRVALGFIFVLGGFGKLVNLDGFASSLAGRGVLMASVMAFLGAVVEAFAGLAIVLGIQVRYAALLVILFTIIASLISHRFWEFSGAARQMQQVQFLKNLAIIGGAVVLLVAGSGRFSLGRRPPRSLPGA